MRRDGFRRAAIRVDFHVDAELAAVIIADGLYRGDGNPGKKALEDTIRTCLYNMGRTHYNWLYEKKKDKAEWEADVAWARGLVTKYWPEWNFVADARIKEMYDERSKA